MASNKIIISTSPVIQRIFSYRVGLGYQKDDGILHDSYERWNVKAAIDHKINDRFSIGALVNLSTSLKDYGSKNSVITGFRANPYWVPYYWEGENKGELILQPAKMQQYFPMAAVSLLH